MKTRNYLTAIMILLAISLGIPSTASAQHHHRPHWVDVHCCDAATRYVFFPEHNFYYDLVNEVYFYPSGGVWVTSYAVPAMYASIDLAIVPIIELDIHVDRPFMYNHDHLAWYRHHHHDHYYRYYRGHGHEGHYAHYYERNHHRHDYYDDRDRHDNGNHYGHYKNNNGHGNHKGGHGNGHGNGNGNYKNYDKKGSGSYANRTNEHRGNGSGNERSGNGGRSSNGRGR